MENDVAEGMEVLPLHSVPHLTEQCCYLLNLEWKRSEVARLRSLEASCDKLPSCLVLIRNDSDIKEVIGHSKLSRIPSIPEGCFIESVVIHPNFRRKGLGKYLMKRTEQYAKSRGFSIAYLSTHDQQIFYGKLGYLECPPVSIYGAALPISPIKDREASKRSEESNIICMSKEIQSSILLPRGPAPPPPPPLPVFREATGPKKYNDCHNQGWLVLQCCWNTSKRYEESTTICMSKGLQSSIPLPRCPAPPAPLPLHVFREATRPKKVFMNKKLL